VERRTAVAYPLDRQQASQGVPRLLRAPDLEAQVRAALAHLDDLGYLQTLALARHFQEEPGRHTASAAQRLRQTLLEAIAALRPEQAMAASAHAWRSYQLLQLRHTEGRTIASVLDQLAISRSEYYRDYRSALAALLSLFQARLPAFRPAAAPTIVINSDRVQGEGIRHGTTLPLQLTSFVGRQRELAEVAALLQASRLVTLTGAGGCGKTRLALETAQQVLPWYRDGVALVELAPLTEPALVTPAIATAVGVREKPGEPLLSTLQSALHARQVLLLLDNCEHLLDACAQHVDALLRACPDLQVLATSREALGISGEQSWLAPSLPLPEETATPAVALQAAAVQLFVERAQAVLPSFALSSQNVAAVVQVCRRLDGIPLALELAAACLRSLSPQQLATRLDQRFQLLVGGSRAALPRQQTLRAMVDWSYHRLSEGEQRLFRQLSVFVGDCTLEAVEAVGSGEGIEQQQVAPLLARLVEQSLVLAEGQVDGEERYRLLETLRQYGWEELVAAGEAPAAAERHAAYYLGWAEEAAPQSEVGHREQVLGVARFASEYANLRSALRWLIQHQDVERAVRLAQALFSFWETRGALQEIEQALLEQSLALYQQLGDQRHVAWQFDRLGAVAHVRDDYALARRQYQAGLAIRQTLASRNPLAWSLQSLGCLALDQADPVSARPLLEECLRIRQSMANSWMHASSVATFAALAAAEGRPAGALQLAGAVAAFEEATGFRLREVVRRTLTRWLAVAQAALDEPAASAALAVGRTLSLDQAIAEALRPVSESGANRENQTGRGQDGG